jgi:hypothetical protein
MLGSVFVLYFILELTIPTTQCCKATEKHLALIFQPATILFFLVVKINFLLGGFKFEAQRA